MADALPSCMIILPHWLTRGYLRLIAPLGDWLVRQRVSPNTITTVGTLCTAATGVFYGAGLIRTGGWFMGLTAFFDVLDGEVARRTGRASPFGAFYDSTLDRVADAAVMGGLLVFFATDRVHGGLGMILVCLAALVGAQLTSYTRAKADALGIEAKIGMLQRPERVTLLSAPMAFFGLALDAWVLRAVLVFLAVTAWLTVIQRVRAVRAATRDSIAAAGPAAREHREALPIRA
jgi:CDP-diacylglycerol---glycerol-3-phosphate 3-phosphatidyltransferase